MNMRWCSVTCWYALLGLSLGLPGLVSAQEAVRASTQAPEAITNTSPVAPALSWGLALPPDNGVVPFKGVVNHDTTGVASAQMLYPAVGGIGGLIAAVVTHGVIVESAKNSQKTKLQESADRVLEPYQSVLAGFRQHDLMQRAVDQARTPGPKQLAAMPQDIREGLWIQSAPQFSLTQDHRAIVLENSLSVSAPGRPEAFKGVIKVVSIPAAEDGGSEWWRASDGARLKSESAALFAESIDIVLSMARQEVGAAGQSEQQKTVRYLEGGTRKMERAQVLSHGCERLLIRNLRGDVMSVPLIEPGERCKVAAQTPAQR